MQLFLYLQMYGVGGGRYEKSLRSCPWLSCRHAESLPQRGVLWLKPHGPLGPRSANCSEGNTMFLPSPKARALLEGRQRAHAARALGWPVGDRLIAKSATGLLAAGDLQHLSELWFLPV